MQCGNCTFYEPDERLPGYGHCARWHQGYALSIEQVAKNEAWVEDDEGWGNIVGSEFGCVLFNTKEKI